MAELATIARPYADALFKASASDLKGAGAWVERLAAIAADPQLQQYAADPTVSSEQVQALVAGVYGEALPAPAQNFMAALIDNGRLAALPEVAHQFRALANAQSGSSDAVVYSAFPIDDAALTGVKAALEKRFGRKLDVTVQVQPDLIGGIRVSVGDEVLDTSVRARLEKMRLALAA